MNNKSKLFSILMVLIIAAGLIGPVGLVSGQAFAKAHPLLLQIAAENPEQAVSVIVQKLTRENNVEALVPQLGGLVTKNLSIINAFVAELGAGDALAVARDPGVRWVSLDAPVERSTFSDSAAFYDGFAAESFNGNDGTTRWNGSWQELGEANGPTSGYVRINTGYWCASNSCISIGGGYDKDLNGYGLSRQADLRGASAAALTFSYRRKSFDENNSTVKLQVSADGGASWNTLTEYKMSVTDNRQMSQEFDISAYQSANTQIRFVATGKISAYFNADNVQIKYVTWQNQYLDTTDASQVHAQGLTGQGVGIAVIDSGIAAHSDLSGRLLQPAGFPTGDAYGHGTHVASITAGAGSQYKGVAPGAHVFNLNITDASGMAYESDVVEALEWVYNNHTAFNIRVVNMSLNSTLEGSYHKSPIDAASEILWFNGVVVVASVGNKGPAGGYNTAKTAPANDPFLIVVGASDEHGTTSRGDDTYAPFASSGVTEDGHSRPDIVAPGFNIIAALSSASSWKVDHPDRVVGSEHIRLSGTSMSAPMVAGAVALLLQDEPNLTPDQVKYRLLNTASVISGSSSNPNSYPYLDVYAAVTGTTTESANTGLVASQLLWTGDDPVTWESVAWNSVAWNSVAWNSVAWNSAIELDGIFWGPGNGKGNK